MVKNLPAMQETQVQSLGQEDPWRRVWKPASVFLPGESHGQRSLARSSPWGRKESDMTERHQQLSLPDVSILFGQKEVFLLFSFSFAAVKHLVVSQSIFKLSNND